MLAGAEQFEDLARDLPVTLDWLIGIGIGAQRNRVADVSRLGQLGGEKLDRIRLGEQLGLEVQSGGQVEVGVAWSRVAVHATVFAALVGIDRLREWNVGRIVAR